MSSKKGRKTKRSLLPRRKSRQHEGTNHIITLLFGVGILCVLIGLFLFAAIYYPVVFQEAKYRIMPPKIDTKAIIRPVDEEYGIVIPKIGANAKVIADVSPFNEKEYQVQLTKGVAHAMDTAYPGQFGNTFIFAHSAANWYQANRYNAVFYLLTKLQKDDDVYLFYQGKKYRYKVKEKKTVAAQDFAYLAQDNTKKTLTLMTCWPPGTTLQRLIVKAALAE